MTPPVHVFETKTQLFGERRNRKVITYRCTAKGCETKGRISTIPANAADILFNLIRLAHEDGGPDTDEAAAAVAADFGRL